MNVIYEPKGSAREYSPLVCNLYMRYIHGGKYFYAPTSIHKKPELGKLCHNKGVEESVDWPKFREDAVALLESFRSKYYI